MKTLIMSAPNGAKKTKADHPQLPMSIAETVQEAQKAHQAGAAILHAHVRDINGHHTLDHGLYRELLGEMALHIPTMPCQITTEAVEEQFDCLIQTQPQYASIAIREITSEGIDLAARTYHAARDQGTHIQHILYDLEDLALLRKLTKQGHLNTESPDILYVLGKYNPDFRSHPDELDPFLTQDLAFVNSWMVCAFGAREYDIMVKAAEHGGHARIGFENNLHLKDGTIAPDNAALIRQFSETADIIDDVAEIFSR